MKKEDLKQMAEEAIEQWNNSKFRFSKQPLVQFAQHKKLPKDFLIAVEYVGCNRRGLYVYNIDAKEILRYVMEFGVNT